MLYIILFTNNPLILRFFILELKLFHFLNCLLVSDSHERGLLQLFEKQSIFNLKSVISPGATFEYVFTYVKLHFNSSIDTDIVID